MKSMADYTKPINPIDPTLASDPTSPMTRVCKVCFAILPMENYGLCRSYPQGHHIQCKECRSQTNKIQWHQKHHNKRWIEPDVIRSVSIHNERILSHALSKPDFSCIGFVPHTDKVYSIVFGRNRHDMESMAVFLKDGTSYFEIVYSGISLDRRLSILLANLREHGIRLEWGEAYMLASKNVIYWYK